MRPLWDYPVGHYPSWWRRRTPPQLLAGSFLLLIAVGTIGLKTLPGVLAPSAQLSWLDAVFTATSAVCTTGLIVVDTATAFTPLGQAWILLLIQCGGIGILTFTTLAITALGGRPSWRQQMSAVGNPMEIGYHRIHASKLTRHVVLFTLLFESIGALLLYMRWAPQMGWIEAAWPALFHAVSAFCNAGFSTFPDNMMPFRHDAWTLLVICGLVISGGLGFLTWEELYLYWQRRHTVSRFILSLHSRLVLTTSAALLILPTPLIVWLEYNTTLAELSWSDKWLNAFFICVNTRTCGFNTVDHGQGGDAANYLLILLMSVGGSPGSMAGGMKTTTLALLLVLAWSRFKGWETTSVWGRSLRKQTTDRAIGLFVIGFCIVTAGIFLLSLTEPQSSHNGFLHRMFEAVSAFNLVGLSMGLTPHLSATGRWVIIALMYLGRVGPLAVAAALAVQARAPGKFRYAYEEVVVG
jgi:trk system potassium uptake protein TrkH